MDSNEVVQWSIVAIMVLFAILWVAVRIIKINRLKRSSCQCGSCTESETCKAKALKDEIDRYKNIKVQPEDCHDGQSARN